MCVCVYLCLRVCVCVCVCVCIKGGVYMFKTRVFWLETRVFT